MATTLAFVLIHLVIFGLLAATAFALGRLVIRDLAFPSAAAEIGVASSIGLGGLGLAGLGLGMVGLLTRTAVLLLVAGIHLAALPMWSGVARRWRETSASGRRRALVIAVLGLALLSPCLLLPLYPPSTFDATMYHLPFASFFAEEGRVAFAPHLRYPVFPQLVELVFTLMLLVAGDVSAALVQTLSMLLVALILYAWGEQAFSRRCGLWAAAIWLGNPLVVWNAGAALVDVALALFVVSAAYSLSMWWRTGRFGWLALGAAGSGFAAATKYHGLLIVVAFGGLMLLEAVRHRRLAPIAGSLAIVALVAAPWYGRIYYYTGNPVFPFFSQVFGESEWSFYLQHRGSSEDAPGAPEQEEPALELLTAIYEVPGRLALRVVRLLSEPSRDLWLEPWQLSFGSHYFGSAPVSPAYLLALPFVLLLALRDPLPRVLLAVSSFYSVIWFVSAADPRYLTPVLSLLALPTAAAFDQVLGRLRGAWARPPRHVLVTVLGILIFISSALVFTRVKLKQLGPLPVTAAEREAHLARNPRYAAISYLNRTRGSDYTVYAIKCESLVYHARGRLLGDHYGPARFSKVKRWLQHPPALHSELRRLGAEYFLVPACEQRFKPRVAGEGLFIPIYREREICIYQLSDVEPFDSTAVGEGGVGEPERRAQNEAGDDS